MKIDTQNDTIKIYDFNAEECFRIARKLESESISLYQDIKAKIRDADIAKAIDHLISEELCHMAYCEQALIGLGVDEIDAEHLVEIVDTGVVSPLAEADVERVLCNRNEAVRLGISLEKRAIAFYESILAETHNPEGREALEKIIEQERGHRDRLQALVS